ncbi:MAG: hypothetical protein A2665_02110 [Candidatus Zambryskibacteria bacterium RIFCSPHIGHO2_01_FULL_46_30]|uniref:Uncharacterized protein n=1 Tax=Candidatus Zambryskibacteria bacterium RIFCSPHIGHO2_01_FULL_46_30 TaxID=1802739 RepID=A0A1G2T5Q0_9BACT|nr:MAG: hypothetical protein A2665_02110 [Candidatus Zambryskibacteria bacterium RIFCSPHIGHO2_01_FULL_46_30]OHB06288.1 MAG: hypothetical protein A3B22_00155 [Candidatus Zambryskibacteria bacterium RIFCSPLOWO2_01_FULL_47_33]
MSETSQKQIEANRENGKKGGVKTEEGKAVSRYNAIKHGLLSKEVLLNGEDEKTLIEIGRRLRTELQPQTELELVLVDRITANVWRLRRVMQIEREMIDDDRKSTFSSDGVKTLGQALSYDFANHDTYGKLVRYESSIERGIFKALHELQRLQSARNGENVLPPIALDVDVSGEKEDGFVS